MSSPSNNYQMGSFHPFADFSEEIHGVLSNIWFTGDDLFVCEYYG
jgi:hypothetical protein